MNTATQMSGVARLGIYCALARKGEGAGCTDFARRMPAAWQGISVSMIAAGHVKVGDAPQREKHDV